MMSANVLIIGSGGREHALAWKLAQSPRIGKLFVAPGNGGTHQIAENIAISATNTEGLVRFAEKAAIDLAVVGPDDSLASGVVDAFHARGLHVFGPTRAAAEIEASKAFSKRVMQEAGIPTASFRIFRKYNEARAYVQEHGAPIVVKASGLALGKGAYPCKTLAEAENALTEIMISRIHRDAGDEVVIEEFLEGQEISIHAFCDGKTFALLPPAQDHKPVRDGDEGKNTGGMGTIVPVPWVSSDTMREVSEHVVRPTLEALTSCGRPFTGLLYPGLKIVKNEIRVLEFNARFGDPETQSYMRLLRTDLLDILEACVEGRLSEIEIKWHSGFAVCVTVASGGYPDEYRKGLPIYGIAKAERVPNVVLFHAGTKIEDRIRTSGGRVLGVSAVDMTLQDALDRAYEAEQLIRFEDKYCRHDIGAKVFAAVY